MRAGTLHERIPEGELGTARVVHDSPDELTRMRAAFDRQPLNADTYTRLFVDGQLYMTDAEFECWTNMDFVHKAFGNVLIAGLGLGLVLQPLINSSVVESITILERSSDVIALIGPRYEYPKLTLVHADVHEWTPPKKTYHFIYFDIWANVPNSDTLAEIRTLKQRYRSSLAKHGRSLAWCENYARR